MTEEQRTMIAEAVREAVGAVVPPLVRDFIQQQGGGSATGEVTKGQLRRIIRERGGHGNGADDMQFL